MNIFLAPKTKQAFLYLGAIALCLTFIACNDDDPITPDPPPPDPDPDPEETVADVIEERDELSEFYNALLDADLVGSLADAEEVTVFAPDNEAFAAADLADADTQAVLEYHIADGNFTSGDLNDGDTIETWQGTELEVTIDEDGNVLLNGAMVVEADISADNGVVHVIDAVMDPEEVDDDVPEEGTVVDTIAEQENLTTFSSAIVDADLETDMRAATDITVFAPNDEAFEEVDLDALTEDELRNTVEFHIVDGRFLSDDITEDTTLTTWQGGEIEVTVENGTITLNGAEVVDADFEADNGVVHIIDAVLDAPDPDDDNDVPEDNTVVDVIEAEAELSALFDAIVAADLEDTLRDAEEVTVFAPNDAAFEALEEDPEDLENVLLFHVTGETYMAADLEDGMEITMLNEGTLTVTVENETVTLNGATVVETDLEADNGVVHIIDSVLIPENGDDNGNGNGNGDNG